MRDAGEVEPPPSLRAAILAGARYKPHRDRRAQQRSRWALVAGAGLAAFGIGTWAFSLDRPPERTQTAATATVEAVVLLTRSDTRRLPLHGANGLLAVGPAGRAVLVISGLSAAPAGKKYEAWLIRSGPAAPAGLFSGGGRLSVVTLTRRVPLGALVAVSLERAAGAARPHGPLVFAAAQAL